MKNGDTAKVHNIQNKVVCFPRAVKKVRVHFTEGRSAVKNKGTNTHRVVSETLRVSLADGTQRAFTCLVTKFSFTIKFLKVIHICPAS